MRCPTDHTTAGEAKRVDFSQQFHLLATQTDDTYSKRRLVHLTQQQQVLLFPKHVVLAYLHLKDMKKINKY